MRDVELGRIIRALRRRRGWRQQDCAVRARVHRSTWSNLERGHLERLSLATLRRCLAVLEVRLQLVPSWRGAALGRLLDETHAALQSAWKARLERWGWQVWVEVSFNRFGDRGRIDLLAWQPVRRVLLVVEVKTEIADAQALLGGMDVKVRVAPHVARSLGLGAPRMVVPLLLVAEGTTNRDRVRRLEPLFARFAVRGRRAVSWLRRPEGSMARGLLIFTDLRFANGRSVTRVAPHRMRLPRPAGSVQKAPHEPWADPGLT
jgi:transcriptional regulator with XRE-family HTH domain